MEEVAASVAGQQELIEARQYEHLKSLDMCYYEGYTALREAAGYDLREKNHLTESYGPFLAFRREILKMRLLSVHSAHEASGAYTPNDRFCLDSCGDLSSRASTCVPVASSPAAPSTSYMSWRRALLDRRFAARHAAFQEEIDKKLAAEAMQRALEAQARELGEESVYSDPKVQAQREPEPLVWRIKGYVDVSNGDATDSSRTLGRNGAADASARSRSITCVTFSSAEPDFVAVGTETGDVHLINTTTASKWITLSGHSSQVTGLSWKISTSENILVSVSMDKTIRVWHVSFPRKVAPPPLPMTPIRQTAAKATPSTPLSATAAAGFTPTRRGVAGKAEELEKVKKDIEAEAERAKLEEERARGLRLEGGSAYCVKVIQTDFMLSHVHCWPSTRYSSLAAVAAVEDADLDAEAALEAAEAAAANGSGSTPSSVVRQESGFPVEKEHHADRSNLASALSPVSKVGGFMVRGLKGGIKGSVAAARMMGDATMGAIESVPLVGGAVGKTVSIMKAGVGAAIQGVSGRKERRGHILIVDLHSGRVLQSKRVAGLRTAKLTRANSYVTSMAFTSNASALFVGDARGLLHAFVMDSDASRMLERPIKDSYVVYGEGSQRLGGGDSESPESHVSRINFASLSYRPMDSVWKHPILLGLDTLGKLHAFKVTYAEPKSTLASAAVGGARAAVGVVTAGALMQQEKMGPVYSIQEITLLHAAGATPAMSTDDVTDSPRSGDGSLGRIAGAGVTAGLFSGVAAASLSDALFCSTSTGEIFIFDPHADPSAGPGRLFGLMKGGRIAAAGSGVSPGQVAAKLTGHARPVHHLALNEFESNMLSCDDSGSVVVWEKVSLSEAQKAGGATGYVCDALTEAASMARTVGSKFQERLLEQINQSSVGRAGLASRSLGEGSSLGRFATAPGSRTVSSLAEGAVRNGAAKPPSRALPAAWRQS